MSPRDRILARRAKFMAAAFVGITGCSDDASPPPKAEPCLSVAIDSGVADARDAADASDTEPMVCLTSPVDSGFEDTADDATDATDFDTGAMPCLAPPPDDGG